MMYIVTNLLDKKGSESIFNRTNNKQYYNDVIKRMIYDLY